MLLSDITLKEYDFSYLETIPLYIKDHWVKTLAKLVSIIPKIGKPLFESYEKVEKVRKDLIEQNQNFKEPEASPLLGHLKEIEQKEGAFSKMIL
jgi:hypothetical protein